ncbi:hypothetical protein [Escherichia coli ISC41]|nr:hypothetical protein [Escherichia coli ISC41]
MFFTAAPSAGRPNASQPIGCRTFFAQHALVAGDHVTDGVVANVAHV